MEFEVFLVDAFTGEDAEGNPAGVVISDKEIQTHQMQDISSQIGFSETAFIYPLEGKSKKPVLTTYLNKILGNSSDDPQYHIRWFTTVVEVPLCGHATLAAATVLFHQNPNKTRYVFQSQSGVLSVFKKADRYYLDFPTDKPEPAEMQERMKNALGLDNYVTCCKGNLTGYLLIQVSNEDQVAGISPNYYLLKSMSFPDITGIVVTAQSSDPDYDFVSRFFDPWAGIMEDPVTGSAHTLLGPFWQKILQKNTMTAMQMSNRRGILHLELQEKPRIYIGGKAQITGKKRVSAV